MEIECREGLTWGCVGTVEWSTVDHSARPERRLFEKMSRSQAPKKPKEQICSAISRATTDRGEARRVLLMERVVSCGSGDQRWRQWLKTQYPEDGSLRVSRETIYRSLFIQARGVLKKELLDQLRSKRRMRRSRHASASGQSRGQIVDAVSIRERPGEVEDRAVPGHWEGDLLAGAKNTYIATLVERHSRFAVLIKVPSKETNVVVAALSRHVRKLPATLKRSLTWDRGLEMAKHKDFTVATDVQVYFCDPQSPWQRGTNENTNLLLRQYFPRGTDLSVHSQAQLDQVALRLNQRLRKTLGFQTPASKLQASVALTI
jgi:IS30 family transposase